MKAFAGLGVILFLVITLYWMSAHAGTDEPDLGIQMAFGNAADNEIDLHVVVGVLLANKDRAKEKLLNIKPKSWDDWIVEHFFLTDSAGKRTELTRKTNSSLIRPHQVIGTEQFFMVARVKSGEDYTFDFVPTGEESITHRYLFTAPAVDEKVRLCMFKQVE